MNKIFRAILLILYIFVLFTVKSSDVFAYSTHSFNSPGLNCIVRTKPEIDIAEQSEQYYAIIPGNNNAKYTNNNNKNYDLGLDDGCILSNNSLKYICILKNSTNYNYIYSSALNYLKNFVNTRAP